MSSGPADTNTVARHRSAVIRSTATETMPSPSENVWQARHVALIEKHARLSLMPVDYPDDLENASSHLASTVALLERVEPSFLIHVDLALLDAGRCAA